MLSYISLKVYTNFGTLLAFHFLQNKLTYLLKDLFSITLLYNNLYFLYLAQIHINN